MSTSTAERTAPRAVRATISKDELTVDLSDGWAVIAPLAWYPRLLHGTDVERKQWKLIGAGEGIHWPALDEDISVEGLLDGRPSGESRNPSSGGSLRVVRLTSGCSRRRARRAAAEPQR